MRCPFEKYCRLDVCSCLFDYQTKASRSPFGEAFVSLDVLKTRVPVCSIQRGRYQNDKRDKLFEGI